MEVTLLCDAACASGANVKGSTNKKPARYFILDRKLSRSRQPDAQKPAVWMSVTFPVPEHLLLLLLQPGLITKPNQNYTDTDEGFFHSCSPLTLLSVNVSPSYFRNSSFQIG
ncbi:Hypothetical predicted protein [Scomber scombrus]|uniref:Uncharacterized protein n=1 Tax=Scomber scombrus TaxID=13677 RepID=A0AAV1PQA3_SCOSC